MTKSQRVPTRNNRRVYGFATRDAAWAFARACWQYAAYPISAGFPSLRPETGLYTVETIALYQDVSAATDSLAKEGELISVYNT